MTVEQIGFKKREEEKYVMEEVCCGSKTSGFAREDKCKRDGF